MANREQIFDAIRAADKSGDYESVRLLGNYLKANPEKQISLVDQIPKDKKQPSRHFSTLEDTKFI